MKKIWQEWKDTNSSFYPSWHSGEGFGDLEWLPIPLPNPVGVLHAPVQ